MSQRKSLFIVNRFLPALHDHLCVQFGAEPDVDVVLDRRRGERRAMGPARSASAERRQGDRRHNTAAEEDIRAMGYAFVREELTSSTEPAAE